MSKNTEELMKQFDEYKHMKFILNDPEHLPVSVFEKFFGYFRSIFI